MTLPRAHGEVHEDLDMWTYWRLQEGEIRVDPEGYTTARVSIPLSCTSIQPNPCARIGTVT